MKLVSVNVGLPRKIAYQGYAVSTGIYKEPVDHRVMVRAENVDGDRQGDLTVHGGVDKAVYAYPLEHYAYWQKELGGGGFPYGQFGENLTVAQMAEDEVHIGDVFGIGGAELEVSQPREPCYKLWMKMDLPEFPRMFLASGRVGFYFRVRREGEIGAGDAIVRIKADTAQISIADLWRLRYVDKDNLELTQKAVDLPALSPSWRKPLARRLGSGS